MSTYVNISLPFFFCLDPIPWSPQIIFSIVGLWSFRESTPSRSKGHLSGWRKPLLPIISARQAFLHKGTFFFAKFWLLFLEAFYPLSKIPLETKTSDRTVTFVTLSITRISHYFGFFNFLAFYTLIIACFALFHSD